MIDSNLAGGTKTQSAMQVEHAQAQLFVRAIQTGGYGVAISTVGKAGGDRITVASGKVQEWLNGPITSLGDSPKRSMHLPIEEVPPSIWQSDPEKWATPEDFQGDEQTRVQAAFNSGKQAVMFTKFGYSYKDPVSIPASVVLVDLMQQNSRAGNLEITEASDKPLVILHPGNRVTLNIRAPRTVIVRYGDLGWSVITEKPTTVHILGITNTGPKPRACPPNVKVYARSINNENKGEPNFPVAGGMMWVLGFKTEGSAEAFAVRDGGVLEVLGGYRNQCGDDKDKPMILNDDSNVSFVGFSNMAKIFPQAIWETRKGETKKITKDDLPKRPAYAGTYFVPLYSGYDPAKVTKVSGRR
ncbi:MAG: hypothetical protein H8M99_12765 [Gloeobacteraceae cyanobacterium ES-bin-144]|nr:hypothetical protein [Verrucomicrobiales bacterium]